VPSSTKSCGRAPQAVSDAQLIEHWVAGDSAAGRALLDRYLPTLRSFFRNRAREESEDLIQQTFLCCVEARERFRGDASVRTFILAIARTQLFRHYRTAGRQRQLPQMLPAAEMVPAPSDRLMRQQDMQALSVALRSVPSDMQAALELAYWEDLAAPEIALRLDIPLGTVYSRLRRARELLRERLDAAEQPEAPEALPTTRRD
jgi:RNA polymerase sigma factor (sigma-70 family)